MTGATRQKGGALARLAGMFCQQSRFMAFCGARSAAEAAVFIRRTCNVKSRAELDHDPKARQLFHDYVRKPYVDAIEKGRHSA